MGFGVYSGTYKFIPRSVPVKPPTVLRNILEPAGTSQTVLHVDFDHLLDTGGSAITSYNFYLKDNGPKNINSNSAWSTLVANNVYVINGANLPEKVGINWTHSRYWQLVQTEVFSHQHPWRRSSVRRDYNPSGNQASDSC